MGDLERALADLLIERGIDLFRLEAGIRDKIVKLLNDMAKELRAKLSEDTLSDFGRARLNSMLKDAAQIIADYYLQARDEMTTQLTGLAQHEAQATVKLFARVIDFKVGFGLPGQTVLETLVKDVLIQGAPSRDWWARQSAATTFSFSAAVRQGILQGETNDQIIRRVIGSKDGAPGILATSRKNAAALVHSSVQTVANASRLETFKKNGNVVKGVRQLSTLDGRTTDICLAYSDGEWDLDGKPINKTTLPFVNTDAQGIDHAGPPRHWNCRSTLVPITKTWAELGGKGNVPEFKPSQRASMDGPVAGDTSMEAFIDRKPKGFLDDLLGPGRAQLYRDGKITLQQLVDQSGRPLTLAELKAKYDN
jgi:hypothetical protein